jgi:beta-lactamase regulating signal transducer with metallopeptidase domain
VSNQLLDEPLAQAIGWALVHFIWQGTVVGAATAIVLRALADGRATARYFVACLGLALMLLAPVSWVLSARAPEAVSAASVATMRGLASIDGSDRIISLAVVMWMAGVILLSLRLVAAYIGIERLKRATEVVDHAISARVVSLARRLGIERTVRVFESTRVQVPTMVGWLRPVILLPASVITGLPAAHLDAVLAHELAHVRRHDYLVNVVQAIVETLLFYHPVVWWCSRQIRIEREHCCDDIVVAACGDRVAYATALAQLEELRRLQPMLSLNVTGGRLIDRVRRLLAHAPVDDRRPTPSMIAAAVAVVMTVIVLTPGLMIVDAADAGIAVQTDRRGVEPPPLPPLPPVPPLPAQPQVPATPRTPAQAPVAPAPPAPPAPPAAAPPAAPALPALPPAPPAPPAAPAPAQAPAAPAPPAPPAPPTPPEARDLVSVEGLARELARTSKQLLEGADELHRAAQDLARQEVQLLMAEEELAKMRVSALASRDQVEMIRKAIAELEVKRGAVDFQLDRRDIAKQLEALSAEIEKMRAR